MASYKDKITSNGGKIAYFVKWYVDTPMKKRTKEDFDKNAKGSCSVDFEHAMSDWLQRIDVQDSIKEYMKTQKFIKITDIYDSMCDKATKGDCVAAKWVIEFSKSDFFCDEEDEADSYLNGIDIPVLKKGK